MPFLQKRCKTDHFNSKKIIKPAARQGFYSILTKNVNLYEGYILNNKKHGFGIDAKRLKNKTFAPKYKGFWDKNKKHNHGNCYYVDGGYYVGNWRNGRRAGFGKMWYSDGSFYGGEWMCGERNGLGLFVYVNGDRYEGRWKCNKKHGIGRLFHLSTGQMQEGAWYEDNAICTSIEDIAFRQSVPYPTPYPIKEITLIDPNVLLITEQLKLLHSDSIFTEKTIESRYKASIKQSILVDISNLESIQKKLKEISSSCE